MTEAPTLLLDINVLLALAWPTHQFHARAVARLEAEPTRPWATCALSQLGFVRISCNQKVMGVPKSPSAALVMMLALTSDSQHEYLAELPPLATARSHLERIVGHKQVTDAYLLTLATLNQSLLVTFDQRLAAIDPHARNVEILR